MKVVESSVFVLVFMLQTSESKFQLIFVFDNK